MIHRGMLSSPRGAELLWRHVAVCCHQLVISRELASKYEHHVSSRLGGTDSVTATLMSAVIRSTLLNADKVAELADPPQIPARKHKVRDPDDWYLEELALAFVTDDVPEHDHCDLVTTDEDTRHDFNRADLVSAGLRGLTIEEGLCSAQDSCPATIVDAV